MAYSQEVLHRARLALEQKKSDKDSVYRQHLQTVYAQLPRVKQIDLELRKSMILATQAVFSQAEGAADALEQAKKANQALQQERQKLIADRFGKDYLDESPVCARCGGVGYIGSQMCRCLEDLCRQEQKKELQLLSCGSCRFEDFQLSYYPNRVIPGSNLNIRKVMEKNFADCRSYAETFGSHGENLLFSGDTGLGKTFLSACIACAVAEKGYSVAYESAPHLFEKLEKAKFAGDPEAEQAARRFAESDLLIVDDLGTELGGQFVTTALYTLINDRLLAGKSTVISTNLTADEMEKRYSSQILSRLRGSYRRMAFVGDDIRILKKRGVTV